MDLTASAFSWFVLSDEVTVEARFLTSDTKPPHGEADAVADAEAAGDLAGVDDALEVDDPQPASTPNAMTTAAALSGRDDRERR
jgi:hypothetical protein